MTREKPSEPNAGELIGKILDRSRLAAGFNLQDDLKAQKNVVMAWLEVLGAARIPPKYYDDLYRRAMTTRAAKIAAGKEIPWMLSVTELVAEYPALLKDLPKPAIAGCPQPHDDEADRLVAYCEGISEPEVLLPCHVCRKDAHEKRRTEIRAERRRKPRLVAVPTQNDEKEKHAKTEY